MYIHRQYRVSERLIESSGYSRIVEKIKRGQQKTNWVTKVDGVFKEANRHIDRFPLSQMSLQGIVNLR